MIKRMINYGAIFKKLLLAKACGQNIPFMLEYQINHTCNLSCKYCYADLATLRSAKEPSYEEIISNIDTFYAMGTRVVRLLGGEPLLRKDIGEIISYLKKKNIFTEISTNGIFLEEKSALLKDVDILQISIDGSKKATDAVRGEGVYDKIISGIEAVKRQGLPIRLHGVYNAFSLKADQTSPVAHLAKISKRYDIPFNFCPFVADFSGERKSAYVSLDKLHPYHMESLSLKQKGYRCFSSEAALKQLIEWPDKNIDILMEKESASLPGHFTRCLAGEMYCFLDSDGSLYPCVPLWKKGANIYDIGVENAWRKLGDIRKKMGCYTCASIGDIEFSKTFSMGFGAMSNTLKNVLALNRYANTIT